jgi:hypothetical protein
VPVGHVLVPAQVRRKITQNAGKMHAKNHI